MCCIAMAVSTIYPIQASLRLILVGLAVRWELGAGRHDEMAFKGLEGDIPGNILRGPNCITSNRGRILKISFKVIMISLH
jgi:hypothetical protein